jgi:hypothetical protein
MKVVKWLGGCSLVVVGVACSIEPRVDTTPLGGTSGVVGAPGAPGGVLPLAGGPCAIDTRTVVEQGGRLIEIVTSRGRLYEFENGVPIQPPVGVAAYGGYPGYPATATPGYPGYPGYPGAPGGAAAPYPGVPGALATGIELQSVPLYAQGPCAGAAPRACVFDTHAFVRLPEGRFLEYVTAYGRQWVFENNQLTGNAVPLASIPRYQQLCAPAAAASGGLCVFDTRVFVKMGTQLVESITAYGRRFEINLEGVPLPNSAVDLMQSPRYANGPCRGSAPGACILETRTFEPGVNGQLVETITSGGFFYTYSADTGAEIQPAMPMTTKPSWAAGPCLP